MKNIRSLLSNSCNGVYFLKKVSPSLRIQWPLDLGHHTPLTQYSDLMFRLLILECFLHFLVVKSNECEFEAASFSLSFVSNTSALVCACGTALVLPASVRTRTADRTSWCRVRHCGKWGTVEDWARGVRAALVSLILWKYMDPVSFQLNTY